MNQNAVNKGHQHTAVQLFDVFILLEKRYPVPFGRSGCDSLLHFLFDPQKCFLLVFNDFGVAVSELKVFRLINDAADEVFVKPQLELLIPLNLFSDFCNLCFVVESLAALRRKTFNHRKRVFQIDDKLDLVMNGTEDLLFNLFCGDAVRAARPAVLIGGADVVDILFRLRRDGLADHWLLTVSAEQEAGKQMRFVLIGRTAHIPLHHDLDCHEVLVGHKSFMRIFYLDPLGFILAFHNADFVVGSAALALRQNADINLVGENTLDGFVCPFCGIAGLEDGIELHTGGMLVFHWGQDAHLVQTLCNAPNGEAVLVHGKDHLHIFADRFIHDELVFVLRRFHVAVRRERADELTALLLDFQTASDFHGDVLAVRIVNQVFERDNKGVGLRITGQTVIRIIDCDEAYAELRENLFNVASAVDVVS